MMLRVKLPSLALAIALTTPWAPFGCGDNEANTQEAKTAESAVGIKPTDTTKKTVQTTRDVIVEKETKVVDKNTGEVLSDKKEVTPVKITEEKQEKTNVKVDVGKTNSSGTDVTQPSNSK